MSEAEGDERILEDIRSVGWSVILIPEDEEGPAFAYTLGLYHSQRHPEVLIQGLRQERLHGILNGIGEYVKGGRRFQADGEYSGILEGYTCAFRTVDPSLYEEYFGYAVWFYRGQTFPALQAVWPDMEGRFPWEEGFPEALAERQLLRLPE